MKSIFVLHLTYNDVHLLAKCNHAYEFSITRLVEQELPFVKTKLEIGVNK